MFNPFFWIILGALIGFHFLDLVGEVLNLRALRASAPCGFEGLYDDKTYERSQQYTRVTTKFGWIESAISLMVLLAFWLSGGFGWLDDLVRALGFGPIVSGLVYVAMLGLGQRIIALPLDLYDTFVIEERFGFNKTTASVFWADQAKGLLLAAGLGAPLFATVLALFQYGGPLAWLYGWAATAIFMLAVTYIAPVWIMPLFNKFKPLEDNELKRSILEYSRGIDFPLRDVMVIDGSRRSTKANAFFTGFGRNKRIALFDTLIEKHTVPELVAVLAHEIGHFRRNHILQHFVLAILNAGVLFYLASFFIRSRGLFDAFGVRELSVYCGLIFFMLLYSPVSRVLGFVLNAWTRRHEFEADRFAAETTGDPDSMIEALKKLSRDNLSNLTPHPFYVFLHYSHPPVTQRVERIRQGPPAAATAGTHY